MVPQIVNGAMIRQTAGQCNSNEALAPRVVWHEVASCCGLPTTVGLLAARLDHGALSQVPVGLPIWRGWYEGIGPRRVHCRRSRCTAATREHQQAELYA